MSANNNSDKNNGVFVISLDFELLWGVWDVTTKANYGSHITGVKEVIPALVSLFDEYSIRTTFATVGFLFARNRQELIPYLPEQKPAYRNTRYNVYATEFNSIGNDETDDPYHFGFSLFEQLKQSRHEIGTHTFSHYFCLEDGQKAADFDADLKAAKKIAAAQGVGLTSLVFPRNQVNPDYFDILSENGIAVYRGNPDSWIYKPRRLSADIPFIRLCRLLDTYFPISGANTHALNIQGPGPVNIPASRFLKPYNKNFPWFEPLKLKRIMNEMTVAAKKKQLYHLWWHPHNFGVNLKENIHNLTILLNHYRELNKAYGFTNLTMKEAAGF